MEKWNAVEYISLDEMQNEFYAIVEGIDDVKLFSNLLKVRPESWQVIRSEDIEITGGCTGVLAAYAEYLNARTTNSDERFRFIIDHDWREYLNRPPYTSATPLIVLSRDGIESFYICDGTIKAFLAKSTSADASKIEAASYTDIVTNFIDSLIVNWPVWLEALNAELIQDPNPLLSRSDNWGKVKDSSIISQCNEKQEQLCAVADQLGITINTNSILKIVKSKWAFYLFIDYIKSKQFDFIQKCRDEHIMAHCQCSNMDTCMMKYRSRETHDNIADNLFTTIPQEVQDQLISELAI